MIKGITLTLGDGKSYVVPPLTLGALEDNQEALAKGGADLSPESVRAIIDIALAALQRNYPDMTREHVRGLLDVGNMTEVFLAVMDVSGLRRKAQEDAAEPGEA